MGSARIPNVRCSSSIVARGSRDRIRPQYTCSNRPLTAAYRINRSSWSAQSRSQIKPLTPKARLLYRASQLISQGVTSDGRIRRGEELYRRGQGARSLAVRGGALLHRGARLARRRG